VRFKLLVDVVCAKELISVEKNGEADPYVSVKLVPVNGNANKAKKGKTAVAKGSLNPYFDNQLEFDVHSTDLANYKLQFVVKDAINYGVITKAPLLGTVDIPLQNFTKETAIANEWFALNPPNR
jgi:Ca2+-dependent lipid-binding protein